MNKTQLIAICLIVAAIVALSMNANGGYGRKSEQAAQGQQQGEKRGQGNKRQEKGTQKHRKECQGGTCQRKKAANVVHATAHAQ